MIAAIALVVAFVFANAAVVPLAAAAPPVMRADDGRGDYVRLFDQPCANDKVLALLKPDQRKYMRAGETMLSGKLHGNCWLFLPNGAVGILYEDGETGMVPAQLFRPEVGA